MHTRAIEILALKLAQAEANLAITQAQLEQAQAQLEDVIRDSTPTTKEES